MRLVLSQSRLLRLAIAMLSQRLRLLWGLGRMLGQPLLPRPRLLLRLLWRMALLCWRLLLLDPVLLLRPQRRLRLLRPLLRLLLWHLRLLQLLLLLVLLPRLRMTLRRMPVAVRQACGRLPVRQGLTVGFFVSRMSCPRYAAFAARGERHSG